MIAASEHLLVLLATTAAVSAVGQLAAWAIHKYTLLGAFNLYPLLIAASGMIALGVVSSASLLTDGGVVLTIALGGMVTVSARRRAHALGGGGALRAHELSRRWLWQPRPDRSQGERVWLGRQGEVQRSKPWSSDLPYVSLRPRPRGQRRASERGARLPLGEGQHVFMVGATGSGKTTTARRMLAARVLAQRSSLVILDQKGDQADVDAMRRLAAAAGVPFILFDSQDPSTDRWQPLWGSPGAVMARATEAIKESEPYYYAVLRKHLDVVCKVLWAAGLWPPSVPLLIDACHPERYPILLGLAQGLDVRHAAITRSAELHGHWVKAPRNTADLGGAALRIEAALALASSLMVTPRLTPEGHAVAVALPRALRERAVVMFRTHADTMPDEAAALTAVALADLHAAAESDVGAWTLLLDEFGAVISTTAHRALAILQRARSHHGQAVVITQSVSDIEALTNSAGLLESLADNFAAVVAHRQSSPASRDWLARLMGTRELWQQTNQTDGHGGRLSGRGSARRVHEFRIEPDVFAHLDRGEAIVYSPEGMQAQRSTISPVFLPDQQPERVDPSRGLHPVEMRVHGQNHLLLPQADDGVPPPPALETEQATVEPTPRAPGDDDGHPFGTI